MNTKIHEIAPDIFRISTYVKEFNLQFNQFLVRDEQPLLYHTGMNAMFPTVYEAVSKLIDPEKLAWIGYSHFEPDECGSLNEWLKRSPQIKIACNMVGAYVFLNDYTGRQNSFLQHGETFSTGKYNFRFLSTPHLPHSWDASLLLEETNKTLFCSDILMQDGDRPELSSDVISLGCDNIIEGQNGPFRDAIPLTTQTLGMLEEIGNLSPKTLAIMHGSSFNGNGTKALNDMGRALKEAML